MPRVGDAPPSELPDTRPRSGLDNVRRKLVYGAGSPDRELGPTIYAEGWRQRVEQNATLELVRSVPLTSFVNPVVTVAVRSDGSVESIKIVRSSGSPLVDDAVRRIVLSLAPYPAFSPDLALDYDVIEIRRTWSFNTAVRLFAAGP